MNAHHGAGRFAPTPSGDLHVGNLRTAVLAWLFARSTGRRFFVRIEDLDRARSRDASVRRQLDDLRAFGIDWDGPVVRQTERTRLYAHALELLQSRGQVYECFCTRKEIHEAVSAPHGIPGRYPGTCRNLSEPERARMRGVRRPALRLRSAADRFTVRDAVLGDWTGDVDDFVLRRADGTFAYNLAVVVDDGAQGIDQVVRGDDLLASAPRQAYLAGLLGFRPPVYAHVPLVLGSGGARLAKRDGAVTLADLAERGISAARVLDVIADSLDLPHGGLEAMLEAFDPARLPREPWRFPVPR